jgi:putative salt-induced outer membrane protein
MKIFIALALVLTAASAQADWETDTELGFVSQSGNTNQENTFFKTKATKEVDKNAYTIEGSYINTTGEVQVATTDVRLAESMTAGLRYVRTVSEKLGVLGGALWEKNHFQGFENRYSGDLGVKYTIMKTEDISFINETGYRYRKQFEYLPGDGQGPSTESDFARVYFEYKNKITKTSRFKLWVETLYDVSDSENIEVNFEPSIDVAIGEMFSTSVKPAQVSLKLAYKGMYDNVPAAAGLERYDSIVSTTIKVLY